MTDKTELLTKAAKSEFNTAKTSVKAAIETAMVWASILEGQTEEVLASIIEPENGKSDKARITWCVQHCPDLTTMQEHAAKVEDKNARKKAQDAAKAFYAILWRGLVRGASIVTIRAHGIGLEVRARGEVSPFIRLTETIENVICERDTNITQCVQLAKALLEGGSGINAKPVSASRDKADDAATSKIASEVSIGDLISAVSSKLAGRSLDEFKGETREEIVTLYEVLLDLCQAQASVRMAA